MSKIKPMALVETMSQKVCQHSNIYFRTNKKTGRVYSGKLCNPYEGEPSELQTAQRTAFKTQSAAVRAYLKAKKANPDEDYRLIKAAYDKQYKVGSLFGFVMKNYDKYASVINA